MIDKFKSDFWFIADYFWQQRKYKKYTPPARKPDYPEQVLEMLAILEKDHRFIDAYKAIGKDQEMCRYIDELQEEGREETRELYNRLIGFMAKDNRINELIEAATMPQAVNNLFREYKLI